MFAKTGVKLTDISFCDYRCDLNTILLFDKEQIHSGDELSFCLKMSGNSDERFLHLRDHLKIKNGDQLQVSVVNRGAGTATVHELTNESCLLKVSSLKTVVSAEIKLILAAARPPTMKKIMEHGTTMGITHFEIIRADLSEKSFLDSKIMQPEESSKFLKLGLAQARGRYQMPTVAVSPRTYRPSALPKENEEQRFFLDLRATRTFLQQSLNFEKPITLAIGPERGWSENERKAFLEAGFQPVLLSRVPLRVEHAVFSSLAQLELLSFPL